MRGAFVVFALFLGSSFAMRPGFGRRNWEYWGAADRRFSDFWNSDLAQLKEIPRPKTNATTHFYLDAVVDHDASVGKEKRWRQRFYVDDTFWGGDGFPVFVYIGGEGPQGPVSPHLLCFALAREHRALLLSVEHRFYGMSWPTTDMNSDNLRLLTSEQGLADLARLRNHIAGLAPGVLDNMSSPPVTLAASAASSRFVGFGGSYPGALAAWTKVKYPSLWAGTVASSAPVTAECKKNSLSQAILVECMCMHPDPSVPNIHQIYQGVQRAKYFYFLHR